MAGGGAKESAGLCFLPRCNMGWGFPTEGKGRGQRAAAHTGSQGHHGVSQAQGVTPLKTGNDHSKTKKPANRAGPRGQGLSPSPAGVQAGSPLTHQAPTPLSQRPPGLPILHSLRQPNSAGRGVLLALTLMSQCWPGCSPACRPPDLRTGAAGRLPGSPRPPRPSAVKGLSFAETGWAGGQLVPRAGAASSCGSWV